jgi:hypothetical protein
MHRGTYTVQLPMIQNHSRLLLQFCGDLGGVEHVFRSIRAVDKLTCQAASNNLFELRPHEQPDLSLLNPITML